MRVFLLLSLLIAVLRAEVPRIAVVPADDLRCAAFADLLTAELSKSADQFQLVERGEINRLAAEAEIQSLAVNQRALALARLAKADGLIVVGRNTQASQMQVRLTGCADGLIHQSLLLGADDKDPATPARLAAGVLAFPAARIAARDGKPATPVSLLGLRSTLGAHDPLAVTLNTSLAHQLSCQQGLAVTERWKLDDVVFERTLSKEDPVPLATGVVSLDGSFERKDSVLIGHLRLQRAGGEEMIQAQAAVGEPQELVRLLAEGVMTRLAHQPLVKLDASEEAKRYSDLGVWLLSRRLAPEAVQAFESAIALGEDRPETQINRLKSYAAIICPQDQKITNYTPARIDVDGLDAMAAQDFRCAFYAMLRIANLVDELIARQWKGFEKLLPKPNDRQFIHRSVSYLGEEVLDALHRRREHLQYAEDARLLRGIMRQLINKGAAQYGHDFAGGDPQLGFIHETPADAIATYRELLAAKYLAAGEGSRGHLVRHNLWHTSSAKMERAIDWTKLENEAGRQAWRAFSEELATSPDLLARTDAMAFEFQGVDSDSKRLEILERYLAFAEANLDKLMAPGGQLSFYAFRPHWFGGKDGSRRDEKLVGKVQRRYLDLLSGVIEKADWVELATLNVANDVSSFLEYYQSEGVSVPSAECATRLLVAVQQFSVRAQADARWKLPANRLMPSTIKEIRSHILKAYPTLAASLLKDRAPVDGAVAIRAWQPQIPAGGKLGGRQSVGDAPEQWLRSNQMVWNGERLMVAMNGPWLVCVDPVTLKSEVISSPQIRYDNWNMATAGGAVMLWTGSELHVCNQPRERGKWTKLDLPGAELKQHMGWRAISWNGSLYAGSVLPNKAEHPQHWLGRYENGSLNWIVSSNRVPPQHPLDAKKPRAFLDLLPGSGGKPLVFGYLDSGPLDHQLFDFETGNYLGDLGVCTRRRNVDWGTDHIQKSGDRVLHWGQNDKELIHIIEIGPGLEKPRLILRNANPSDGHALRSGWEKTKPLLDQKRCALEGEFIAPVGHAGKLWCLKWEATDETSTERNPDDLRLVGIDLTTSQTVVVPLRYDVGEALRAIKGEEGLDMSHPTIHPFSLTDTPTGLFFAADGSDTWTKELSPALLYIRWDDVNAWISKHHPEFNPAR